MPTKETNWFCLQITFPRRALVKQIQVWHRCAFGDQIKKIVFVFSDGSSLEVGTNLYAYEHLLFYTHTHAHTRARARTEHLGMYAAAEKS